MRELCTLENQKFSVFSEGKHRTGMEESRYVAIVSFSLCIKLCTFIDAIALIDLLPMIELGMSFIPFRLIRWFVVNVGSLALNV